MSETTVRRRLGWISGVGLLVGATLGMLSQSAMAACSTEFWTGSSAANVRYDDGDGVDENNHWFFLDGNDFGRSLACNDDEVIGDVGG